jgi:hypothetical protein
MFRLSGTSEGGESGNANIGEIGRGGKKSKICIMIELFNGLI